MPENVIPSAPTKEEWESVVQSLLNTFTEDKDGKKKHETDPPENFYHHRLKKPGPLPSLVSVESIPENAKTLPNEHSVSSAAPPDLSHLAKHVVTVARGLQAKSIALKAPRIEGGAFVFEVINVL